MAATSYFGTDPEKLQEAADMMKAIAHPIRIQIIELLESNNKMSVNDLVNELGEEQAVISHHLIRMKDRGVLFSKKEGNRRIYRLANPEITGILYCISNCKTHIA